MPLETALRTLGAGFALLTAVVLLLGAPRAPIARAFLPFALGVAGFLGVNTAYDAAELASPLWALASFCSRMATVFVWLFCLVLFDGRVRRPRAVLAVVVAWLVLVVVDKDYLAPAPPELDVSAVLMLFGTGLLLHAGWRAMRDLRDDLVERRRRARPFFALALLALVGMDFAMDLLHGYGWRPASFLLLQNAWIASLSLALALWLLRAEPDLVATPEADVPRASAPAPAAPTAEQALLARLERLMRDERPYLDPELTFAAFAARMGVSEPVLRRTINHGLGHGHFRAYLNGYRVEEAMRRLRDPASAGDKILAIALESGFSSLASFNRVFRQVAGCAPSEYRAGAGAGHAAHGF